MRILFWLAIVTCLATTSSARSNGATFLVPEVAGHRLRPSRSYYMVYPDRPARGILLMLHGRGAQPAAHGRMIHLDAVATAAGLAILYPAALGNPSRWDLDNCCRGLPVQVSEADFLRTVVEDAQQHLGIQAPLLATAGFSNGAMLLARMACDGRDWGLVVLVGGALLPPVCTPRAAAQIWSFQGDQDPVIAAESVQTAVREVCLRNSCQVSPKVTIMAPSVTCRVMLLPEAVRLHSCTVAGGGHSWPGGATVGHLGVTVQDFSLSNWIIEQLPEH